MQTIENLIMRSNQVSVVLEEVWDREDLATKPKPDRWSILEVIEHLNVIYSIYLPKFDEVIQQAEPLTEETEVSKKSILGWLSILVTKPKKGKRPLKMKTMKYLEPHVSEKDIQVIIETFKSNKAHFNEILRQCRNLKIGKTKMATSLGSKVKLYVAECLEFVLVHEERHIVQIREMLSGSIRPVQAQS